MSKQDDILAYSDAFQADLDSFIDSKNKEKRIRAEERERCAQALHKASRNWCAQGTAQPKHPPSRVFGWAAWMVRRLKDEK